MATYNETSTGGMAPATTGATHSNQIVAMFETYEQARTARDKLTASGVAAGSIDILDRNAQANDSSISYERNSEGFWGALKGFFMPEEDSHAYAEGLERGHSMLVVRPQPAQREQVVTMLESFNPIDFDARESEWKQSGWTGAYAGAATTATMPVTKPVATAPVMPATAAVGDEKIEVLEESLRVSKREVAGGQVRVRSYVVERPVEAQVTLREEHVTLERHPVDRPVGTVGADAFRERTIDVTATSEEAVVAKDIRVVEEIGLRKDTTERTETVKDTVRRTEVEIEDETAKLAGTRPVINKPL